MYMFLLNWFIQLQDKANANTSAATKTANAAKPKVWLEYDIVNMKVLIFIIII